jgi:hypothetical protein
MTRSKCAPVVFLMLVGVIITGSGSAFSAQETGNGSSYLLRWGPQEGGQHVYVVSVSGTKGESVAVSTEDFTIRVVEVVDGVTHFVAAGEPVPEGARLGYRFQRALFPSFPYTVDPLGRFEVRRGQPFPVVLNMPLFPEEEVAIDSEWSGGPVDILPDANVGAIPFVYTSTLASVADFRGEQAAVIETEYTVCLPEDAKSVAPFLGLVEGDPPETAGQGAPIGGVVEGSRAHEAGIQPGDFIIAAEGQRIRGWGGLEEILPFLVPEVPVEFRVLRGEEELEVEIAPEGIPVAALSATGGLHSTCFFSIQRRIPLKVDVSSRGLVFIVTDAEGESEERAADLHVVLEYQYSRD